MNKPFFVNVNGELWQEPEAKAKKKAGPEFKRTQDRDAAKLSMGFVVTGRPAGFEDQAMSDYAAALAAYERDPKTAKHPGMRDDWLPRWKRKNKPKKLHKPFELREAAEACAELARKAGWVDVSTDEIMKG